MKTPTDGYWRRSVHWFASAAAATFLINLVFTIWAATRVTDVVDGVGVLQGRMSCGGAKQLNTGFHVLINALSAVMLAGSNFCMQYLSAPTRAQVDAAHELTARTLGSGPWRTFRRVSVPLAARGLLAGAVVTWARAVSEFGAVVVLAYHPRTAATLAYERFTGYGLAEALPVAAALVLGERLTALQAVGAAVLVFADDGTPLSVNAGAEALFGRPQAELLGMPMSRIFAGAVDAAGARAARDVPEHRARVLDVVVERAVDVDDLAERQRDERDPVVVERDARGAGEGEGAVGDVPAHQRRRAGDRAGDEHRAEVGVVALAQIVPLSRADFLVTDEDAPQEALEAIRLAGVEVIVARSHGQRTARAE